MIVYLQLQNFNRGCEYHQIFISIKFGVIQPEFWKLTEIPSRKAAIVSATYGSIGIFPPTYLYLILKNLYSTKLIFELDFWTFFLSILNLIFEGHTGSRNQVWK